MQIEVLAASVEAHEQAIASVHNVEAGSSHDGVSGGIDGVNAGVNVHESVDESAAM